MKILNKAFLSIVAITLGISSSIFAQNYSVNTIQPELKKHATSVIRLDEQIVEIESLNKVIYRKKFAVTILNKNGASNAIFKEYYDKFSKITLIKGTIYDADGMQVKRISKNDIHDFSAVSSGSIYDDSRVKFIDPEYQNYPFTIVYEYNYILKSTLNLPSWSPIHDNEISNEFSKIQITVNNNNTQLRYLERNLKSKAEISNVGTYTIYKWTANNTPAFRSEDYCEPISEFAPMVLFSLDNFKAGDTEGSLESWKSFGEWSYQLNRGRDILPDETIAKIQDLTIGMDSDLEKTAILYKYLQENTRYVSIQVGIGGYQAFEAETVDRLAYGDCKALSNYMYTLLKYAGIKSHYTIINAGHDASPVLTEFPSNQFNHVILCVPLQNDTIWLECTSQTNPFGYLGTFTDNRIALLVKKEGGELTRTPKLTLKDNKLSTTANITLNPDGESKVKINRYYEGSFYNLGKSFIQSAKNDQQKMIYKMIDISHFTVESFKFKEVLSSHPSVIEESDILVDNYVTALGTNLIFDLNLMNKMKDIPKVNSDRKSDIFIKRSISESDSIKYTIPKGYSLKNEPDSISFESDFGSYNSKVIMEGSQLIYIRKFELFEGTYLKNKHIELEHFFESVIDADNKKVIISAT